MPQPKNLRFAVVGSNSLRGREIKSVLSAKKFPLRSLEFFDPDVEAEYSRLTQFRDEPKVVHHLGPRSLEGLDLVFLAADRETNTTYGRLAAKGGYRALDLCETFNGLEDVPIVVAGVNDGTVRGNRAPLIANPHPATIILGRLFHALGRSHEVRRAASFVLQPASSFEEEGIQELVDQSYALLGGGTPPKKVFRGRLAFNLLAQKGKPGTDGFSPLEQQVHSEVLRVLGRPGFPFSLSFVLAPVFHTYSIMTRLELEGDASIADLEKAFRGNGSFKLAGREKSGLVSSADVAGKDHIHVGQIKKDASARGSFWIWAVADNLTLGSALNALEIARALFEVD